jgi:vacuolar-type H+-ATPase subunit I/STV1
LIKQARKTNWFPLTLFIGIPIIWSPVFFVFIFGDFGPAIASLLFGTAMVRLLENNLPRPIKSENNEITQSGTVSISNA